MVDRSAIQSLLRSTQAFCQLLAVRENLQWGVAFHGDRFAALSDVNQYREIIARGPAGVAEALREADEFFAGRGGYHRVAFADEPTSEESSVVTKHGFAQRSRTVLQLSHPSPAQLPPPGVRVLPARAMRAAVRQVMTLAGAALHPGLESFYAEAWEERLNEPSLDLYVVGVAGQPVATGALYQVGDIGRIIGLHALPTPQGEEGLSVVLRHVVALARRLNLPMIVMQVDSSDTHGTAAAQSAGFVPAGFVTEFERINATAGR